MMRLVFLIFLLGCVITPASRAQGQKEAPRAHADVVEVFRGAEAGAPLRVVALGGSITQDGGGWIGPFLQQRFRRSAVWLHNAGMSATSSEWGAVRVSRDVLAHQPDLVLLEFDVNDEGLTNEEATRALESIVVALKTAPRPPAIVVLHAASQNPVPRGRSARVAAHYGLLEVDLQSAVEAQLKASGAGWNSLFRDAVHPNPNGHALYAATIASALQPLIARASTPAQAPKSAPLPGPLSRLPLWLDGRIVPLRFTSQSAWETKFAVTRAGNPGEVAWYSSFFEGVLSSHQAGAGLEIPFRGTTVGLFLALDPDFGTLLASVDGAPPVQVVCNLRDGYEPHFIARDLAPGEHVLRLVLPPEMPGSPLRDAGEVQLGALFFAGENQVLNSALSPINGSFSLDALREVSFQTLPSKSWKWSGPFGRADDETPVARQLQTIPLNTATKWQNISVDGPLVNFSRLSGQTRLGVCAARIRVRAAKSGPALARLTLDYFGDVQLNGTPVFSVLSGHDNPKIPLIFPVLLRAGDNELLVKVVAGGGASSFSLGLSAPGNTLSIP